MKTSSSEARPREIHSKTKRDHASRAEKPFVRTTRSQLPFRTSADRKYQRLFIGRGIPASAGRRRLEGRSKSARSCVLGTSEEI